MRESTQTKSPLVIFTLQWPHTPAMLIALAEAPQLGQASSAPQRYTGYQHECRGARRRLGDVQTQCRPMMPNENSLWTPVPGTSGGVGVNNTG